MAKDKNELDALKQPQSRSEQFLNHICGRATNPDLLPKPESRIEEYLEYLAHNGVAGGAGGAIDTTNLAKLDANNVFTGKNTFKDMHIEGGGDASNLLYKFANTQFVTDPMPSTQYTVTKNHFVESGKYIDKVMVAIHNSIVSDTVTGVRMFAMDVDTDVIIEDVVSHGTFKVLQNTDAEWGANVTKYIEIPVGKIYDKKVCFGFSGGNCIAWGNNKIGANTSAGSPIPKTHNTVTRFDTQDGKYTTAVKVVSKDISIKDEVLNKVDAGPKKSLIIAVGGQSNAVGYDETPHTANTTTNLNPNRLKQLGIYGDSNLKVIPLEAHAHSFQDMRSLSGNGGQVTDPRGTKGIHLPLGNLLLDVIPEDYDIVFVSATYGGTGFTTGHNYGAQYYNSDTKLPTNLTTYRWGVDSPYYLSLRDRIQHMLDLNPENIFGGVVWIQGESDGDKSGANPTEHLRLFTGMTDAFFNHFKVTNPKYATRTVTGKWDRDLWYNVETVGHWYTINACQQIWDNYRKWNSKSYVDIPRDTLCNTGNITSSRTYTHFGHDAFTTVVAPRVANKMMKNITLFANKNTVVDAYDIIGFNPVLDSTKVDATQNDFYANPNRPQVTYADNNLTLNTFVDGTFNHNVEFKDAYHIEFEATRTLYWLHFRGDLDTKSSIVCIGGGNMHGKVRELDHTTANSTLSIITENNVLGNNSDRNALSLGDKVSLYLDNNGILTGYKKKVTDNKYTLWFEWDTKAYHHVYASKDRNMLGLLSGVSGSEVIGGNTTLVCRNVKIQKNQGFINEPLLDVTLYNSMTDAHDKITDDLIKYACLSPSKNNDTIGNRSDNFSGRLVGNKEQSSALFPNGYVHKIKVNLNADRTTASTITGIKLLAVNKSNNIVTEVLHDSLSCNIITTPSGDKYIELPVNRQFTVDTYFAYGLPSTNSVGFKARNGLSSGELSAIVNMNVNTNIQAGTTVLENTGNQTYTINSEIYGLVSARERLTEMSVGIKDIEIDFINQKIKLTKYDGTTVVKGHTVIADL